MPAAPPPADPFYAAVRAFARFWVWFFFKSVEARHPGRVPARGPVLLCINHPNNFIDSLLVGAVIPRKVHYLATAALFRNRLLGRFLRRCGAIPVHRRQDDPGRMDRNVEMFATCLEALRDGRLIAIYPEGTTHAEDRVKRIKTGAARIALAYEADRGGRPDRPELAVIPVGLSFEARKSFGSRVLVAFGAAVPVAPHVGAYAEDPGKAVDAVTTRIQWGMEAQVVHADRVELAELASAVEDLYGDELVRRLQEERGLSAPEIDTLRLTRAITDAALHFKTREPERVADLWHRIQRYRAMLAAHRLRDQTVRDRLAGAAPVRRLRRSSVALAGLPLFAYGALVNLVPYALPRWLSQRLARKETDYATVRLLTSVVVVPLCWGLETWLVWRATSPGWALLFALSLPVSGLAAYHYLAGMARLHSHLRLGWLGLRHRQEASRILAERQAILEALERARRDYLAETRDTLA
ncbi:MAG: 1-acyl-sn-glycerol-3-phosphate acyltransferase [Candidatus Rokuibacteriota bacterium]